MHDLVVPLALASFHVDAYQTVAVQIVAGAMAAVEIGRRIFHWQVREARFFVSRDLRPDTGIAVDRPRFVLPGVVAELARTRNRVEGPQDLARLHIEAAHQPFG